MIPSGINHGSKIQSKTGEAYQINGDDKKKKIKQLLSFFLLQIIEKRIYVSSHRVNKIKIRKRKNDMQNFPMVVVLIQLMYRPIYGMKKHIKIMVIDFVSR